MFPGGRSALCGLGGRVSGTGDSGTGDTRKGRRSTRQTLSRQDPRRTAGRHRAARGVQRSGGHARGRRLALAPELRVHTAPAARSRPPPLTRGVCKAHAGASSVPAVCELGTGSQAGGRLCLYCKERRSPHSHSPFSGNSQSLALGPLSSLATCEVEVWMGCSVWPHNTYLKL